MHLLVPFASALSPAAAHAASTLQVPHLERLLARLAPSERDNGDEWTLSAPHERALARAWGWPAAGDGLLPLGALSAQQDGLPVRPGEEGWALLSPAHWHVGTDQISLGDPQALALDEPTARQLFDALSVLFDADGWALHWGAPTRWYATHASLTTLATASLDRVVGRNVDLWLGNSVDARAIRRLQAEAQMLLLTHPLNEAREDAGLPPVNSFWLSGTGLALEPPSVDSALIVDDRLRAPALAEDWAAWAEAWHALDAGPIGHVLQALDNGQPVRITLCGERHAQTFAPADRPWWRRLTAPRQVEAARWLNEL